MVRYPLRWVAAVLAVVLTVTARAPVRAAEGPENELLKKHGLKVAGISWCSKRNWTSKTR